MSPIHCDLKPIDNLSNGELIEAVIQLGEYNYTVFWEWNGYLMKIRMVKYTMENNSLFLWMHFGINNASVYKTCHLVL